LRATSEEKWCNHRPCKLPIHQKSGRDHFDVAVPVVDDETEIQGLARLHCRVSPQAHSADLADWSSNDVPVIPAGGELGRRLSSALDYVAEKRLCGNRSLCPRAVVSGVENNDPA
jgi:hypothetical protein